MTQKENQKRKNRRGSHHHHNKKRKPKFTNRISDHFSKQDFVCKESGKFKISLGLVGALEELRSQLQKRITIIKGFECPDIAEKKGVLKKNLHTQGLAADITVSDISLNDLFKTAETIPSITGIGINKTDNYIHIDTRKEDRTCWIEENENEIELTDENRSTYLDT